MPSMRKGCRVRGKQAGFLVPALLPFISLFCSAFGSEASSQNRAAVECNTAAELAAALANSTAETIIIASDMNMTERDWEPYNTPVTLWRNVTVSGRKPDDTSWPLMDLGFVNSKVRLSSGVTLEFIYVALKSWRLRSYFQAPGYDLIATNSLLTGSYPTKGGAHGADDAAADGPPGLVLVRNMAYIQRTCLPDSVTRNSTSTLPRPPQLPGDKQFAERLTQRSDCVKSSSAPVTQRCWAAAGAYYDMATFGYNFDERGAPVEGGYLIWFQDVQYKCETLMTEECYRNYGALDCYNRMFLLKLPAPPAGPALPDRAHDKGGGDGDGGSSLLGPLLGGLLGGLVAVLVVVGVLLGWRAARRRRSGYLSSDGAQKDGLGTSAVPSRVASGATGPSKAHSVAGTGAASSYETAGRPVSALGKTASANGVGMAGAVVLTMAGPDGRSAPLGEVQPLGAQRNCGRQRRHSAESIMAPGVGVMVGSSGYNPSWGTSTASGYAGSSVPEHRPLRCLPAELSLLPVTDLTPLVPGINLDARSVATEVKLLPVTLGKGAFGRVVKGLYGTEPVAVKLLDSGLLPPGMDLLAEPDGFSPEPPSAAARAAWRSLVQEVEVLARCQHPNIVRLLAASLRPPRLCIVMELMDTSLDRLMYGGNGRQLSLHTVLHIGVQVARALSYLHPTIMHRDLKPANVLISQPNSDNPVAKLADFGLSCLHQTVQATRNAEIGTAPYVAPEAFDALSATITNRAEVYAMGVILWEMLAGRRPWDGNSTAQIAFAVTMLKSRLPLKVLSYERCPPKLRSLIKACWEHDPARRPAADEVLKGLILVQESLINGPCSSDVVNSSECTGDLGYSKALKPKAAVASYSP